MNEKSINKVVVILICFIFNTNTAFSQSHYLIGKVVSDNNAPIIYANIGIKNKPIGVSSNEEGEFCFLIPSQCSKDTLSISAIGYKLYERPVAELVDSFVFVLEEQVYDIDRIAIMPESELKELIKSVTKNIRKNYSKRKHLLSGFYRELVFRDSSYSRIVEAAVDIQRKGLNESENDLVRIIELRKSNSYVEYGFRAKLNNLIVGETNQIYDLLSGDIINYHNKSFSTKNIFTDKFYESYKFTLEDVLLKDSVNIYKIRFSNNESENASAIEVHYIYVNKEDYGIIKYEYKFQIVKDFEKYSSVNFSDNCMFAHTVYYKKYKENYYPYLFEYLIPVKGKGADKESGNGKQYMKSILMINNVLTKRVEYEKIKKKFMSPKDIDFYSQDYEYNGGFWKGYNILKLNPISSKAYRDMNRGESLEEQFIKNGK